MLTVSQMPEVPGSWPEEGSPYLPGAPMEPVQQSYPQHPGQYQQPYPPQQQYGQTPQYPAPQQPYGQPQQGYPEQAAAQQAVFAGDEQASVPSEFDHLFRDSVPTDRRSISRQAVIGAAPPAPGFAQSAQAAPQPAATALFTPQEQVQPGYPPQQQPGYGGPGDGYGGGGYEPMPQRPGRGRAPFVIGGAVVLVAAVGLYLGLSGGASGAASPQPSAGATATASAAPKQTAQQEADALYQLVSQAKQLRSYANGGVSALVSCNIPVAQSDLNSAVTGRQAELDALAKLNVDQIDGGAGLVADLKESWTASFSSDQDDAKAAADFAGGVACSKDAVKADPNHQAADQGGSASTNAKTAAAKLWNEIMPKYGEPKISYTQL